jgi:hypothetical protein
VSPAVVAQASPRRAQAAFGRALRLAAVGGAFVLAFARGQALADEPDGPMAAPEAAAAASEGPTPLPSPAPTVAPASGPASFGGVFLGSSSASDPYLKEGGKLSIGALSLLRVEDSRWIAGLSAAVLGGSRFQRIVTPYIPKLASTDGFGALQGVGNVASIYTDVMHVPIATYGGYGWRLGPVDLLVAAGPSAHRISVSRFEQISGVASSPTAVPGDQAALSTYTTDRRFTGASKRWGAGVAAVGAALVDVGAMPFVGGRWSLGVVTTASTPIGRQGCQDLDADDVRFGSICVPLEYELTSRTYFTEGKEQYDNGSRDDGALLLPIQGSSFSANFGIFFQF